MIYTKKDSVWMDESQASIPYNRTTKLERDKEAFAKKIVDAALAVNKKLDAFKTELKVMCDEVYRQAAIEFGTRPEAKGNYTWFSFDRSIKIEININERIDFDDLTIKAAKEKLDSFLSENIDGKIAFAKELVIDAFTTSRGKLDAKKVLALLKYRSKISNEQFNDACVLIEQSIRRPDSKTYYRISVKDTAGEYKAIELNFSNI